LDSRRYRVDGYDPLIPSGQQTGGPVYIFDASSAQIFDDENEDDYGLSGLKNLLT